MEFVSNSEKEAKNSLESQMKNLKEKIATETEQLQGAKNLVKELAEQRMEVEDQLSSIKNKVQQSQGDLQEILRFLNDSFINIGQFLSPSVYTNSLGVLFSF